MTPCPSKLITPAPKKRGNIDRQKRSINKNNERGNYDRKTAKITARENEGGKTGKVC